MPVFDCEKCRHSLTKRENDRMFIDCPKCKTVVGMKRRVSLHNVAPMKDSKNMTPGEIAEHLSHKHDLEQNADTLEWKEAGPREFRPEIPRSVY